MQEEFKKKKRKQRHDVVKDEQSQIDVIPNQSKVTRALWMATLLTLIVAIVTSFIITSYQDEGTAQEVVANRISSSTVAGETLFEDEMYANIEARDFEVTNAGSEGGEARMLIWDYNLEDLDEVAILVDGVPVKEKLILTEDAAAISIPVPSTVTIRGVTDKGGGISYAVKFPNNKMTYFNVVTVGQANTYTVLPRP